MLSYSIKAFFVGIVGDFCLQLIVKQRGNFAGLRDYFKQHGIVESLMIAGGLMFILAYIYEMTGLPLNNGMIFIYGGLWDIAFRQLRIMPSLDGYYRALNPIQSFVWGGIPMLIPNLF